MYFNPLVPYRYHTEKKRRERDLHKIINKIKSQVLYCQWVKLTTSEVILKNHKIWMDVKPKKRRKILRETVRTYHIENSYKINCFVCFFINSPVVYSIGRISSKSFNSIYKVFAMNCWQNLSWEAWKWSLDLAPSPAKIWNLFYKKYLKMCIVKWWESFKSICFTFNYNSFLFIIIKIKKCIQIQKNWN